MSDASSKPVQVDANEPLAPGIWKIIAVVLLGPFMTSLDTTVVNVSLSNIATDLHATFGAIQWIVSGYLLSLALTLPLNGWLVDRLGAKRMYLGCFSAFTLASVLCGSAGSADVLVISRVLQGMAGGLLAPMAQMMMARVAGRHLARVVGFAVMPVLIAPIIGPLLASFILAHGSWRWLFYLNLPVGILALSLASVLLSSDEASIRRRPFDWAGFLMLSPSMGLFLFGIERASQPLGLLSLAIAIPLLISFWFYSKKKGPLALIDVALFKNTTFSNAAAVQFFSNGVAFTGQMLIPLYLITGCGESSGHVGWIMAPLGFGMMCSYPCMGYLTEKYGCRWVSAGGATLALVGTLPLFFMTLGHLNPWVLGLSLFFRGVGMGAVNVPTVSAAYSSVPKELLPIATTAINIVQRLGGPIATTLSAILIDYSTLHLKIAGPHAFTAAVGFLLLISTVDLWFAGRLPLEMRYQKAA